MSYVTNAAYKAWQQSDVRIPFAEYLEQMKKSGRYWGG